LHRRNRQRDATQGHSQRNISCEKGSRYRAEDEEAEGGEEEEEEEGERREGEREREREKRREKTTGGKVEEYRGRAGGSNGGMVIRGAIDGPSRGRDSGAVPVDSFDQSVGRALGRAR
jgi:hypothetical protein